MTLILRFLLNKRLAYIYSTPDEAQAAFIRASNVIHYVIKSNRFVIDYERLVIKNLQCRYEEHFLCQDSFIKSDVRFFRCLAYDHNLKPAVALKYDKINSENRLL